MGTESSGGSPLFSVNAVGDLSKPANTLIEKISDAVGGVFKPWQTRRVARADADAEVIKAEGRVRATEGERRGAIRLIRGEGRKQENIESSTEKALTLLNQEAKQREREDEDMTHVF